MPDRDELDRQWQANEAELNRLNAMSPTILLAAHYDLSQFWPVLVALVIGLGLIWLARRGKRD
jgi:hypothetical protein